MKPTVEAAEAALRQGCCVVIGLQSTGEGAAASDAAAAAGGDGEPASSAECTVRHFLEEQCDALPDADREALLEELARLGLPTNPLDEIIHRLGGPARVAEMTGRRHRYEMVRGRWRYVARAREAGSADAVNVRERKLFQAGEKLVAVISEAASTGISLHADRRAANGRRRVHITFQLPWSAERAVQQMGRSHRSNQSSVPAFKLVLSPIGGEWRFASAVANRLQSLGALTQGGCRGEPCLPQFPLLVDDARALAGDRRAAGASSAMRAFTIEPRYGLRALVLLQDFVFCGRPLPNPKPAFILEAYPSEDDFRRKAVEAMRAAGLGPEHKSGGCRLQKFMNRLFGLPLGLQTHVFDLFLYLVRLCFCSVRRSLSATCRCPPDTRGLSVQLNAKIAAAKAANKYSEVPAEVLMQ